MWSFDEMQSFYSLYAKDYENDISLETYPAPFIIGQWMIRHLQEIVKGLRHEESLQKS